MITTLLLDLSRVLLFPTDPAYQGELNILYRELREKPGFVFSHHFVLNQELLSYLQKQSSQYTLAMFTSGVIQHAAEIKEPLSQLFSPILSAEELGLTKTDPGAYRQIAQTLSSEPSEILYIDDVPANISAAKSARLSVIQYHNNEQLLKDLKPYLHSS